jgi:hypothetical protein
MVEGFSVRRQRRRRSGGSANFLRVEGRISHFDLVAQHADCDTTVMPSRLQLPGP